MKDIEALEAELRRAQEESARLRAENDRLRLENERLKARPLPPARPSPVPVQLHLPDPLPAEPVTSNSSDADKIALFRRLFRGRQDVYAVRWEHPDGRSGYAPACQSRWEREQGIFLPLTDQVIRDHLSGRQTVGLYPLQRDETCWFLAADFDKEGWHEDALAYLIACDALRVPAVLERSRSGRGAHAWIFFEAPVAADQARKLGCVLLTRAIEHRHQVGLDSYDRLFPDQDTLPKGGFGNLIALPLQGGPRRQDNSVFVNWNFEAYPDQWAFLSGIRPVAPADVESIVAAASRAGSVIGVAFHGELTSPQRQAVEAVLAHDIGVMCAPTAFGKTVVAAWLIAERRVNTLVLVHRRHLLDQWQERLATFLDLPASAIGLVGGGRNKPSGQIDVALIQSLGRSGSVDDIVAQYGHVIVDECHHVPAFSIERVLKAAKARFVLGLTATPIRKDGHHPILVMQCGPLRFRVSPKEEVAARPFEQIVIHRPTGFRLPESAEAPGIQSIYTALAADEQRNDLICADLLEVIRQGRTPLLLTERTEHLEELARRLDGQVPHLVILRGDMGAKQRRAAMERLGVIPEGEALALLATGRYAGEGLDHARLDTLLLALPISWKGTVRQYAGRLNRLHPDKRDVRIYDYVDVNVPVLTRMYDRRLKGYRVMGYTVQPNPSL